MELAYRKLTADEITSVLADLNGWALDGENIARTFDFGSYPEGPAFAVKVGELAEELNHHPDILITYQKVRVAVHTHDVGGLSPYDIELARRVNALV
jgi:4a-hydroxytetrahydrobiopterin dehydratase